MNNLWIINELWRFRSSHTAITERNDVRNHCSKRQVSTICGLGEHSKIKKRPPPPPPYIFAFWDPSGKFLPYIRSFWKFACLFSYMRALRVQNFSSLLHLEHAFLKHQKPRNLQWYIVALAGFHALVCRSVACALSFVFWVRGYF